MKVLVTGAEGFIGTSVSAALAEGGDEVFYGSRRDVSDPNNDHYRKLDLLDVDSVRGVIAEVKPDVIVNCAGIIDPQQNVDNNPVFTRNILEATAASGQKVGRIIVCGSAGVYGQLTSPDELPVAESTPLRASSPYALSKKTEEEVAVSLGNKYGLPVTIARIFNPIGKGMGPRFLVSNILNQAGQVERGERTELEVGRLDALRDYIDVADVAQAIRALAHATPKEVVYNVGSGKATSNGRLVELILSHYGIDPPPRVRETMDRPEPIVASQADITKLSQETGWEPQKDLEVSVKEIVDEARRKH